jgi:hypothetical protein
VFTLLFPLLDCVQLFGFGGGSGLARGLHGSSHAGRSAAAGATWPGDLRRRGSEGMVFFVDGYSTGLMLTATGLMFFVDGDGPHVDGYGPHAFVDGYGPHVQ